MRKIKSVDELKGLEQGTNIVRVLNDERIEYYKFLMVHPYNENYVLLLETASMNAYKFFIPDIMADNSPYYIEYTRKELYEIRKEYLLNKLKIIERGIENSK